MPRPPLSSTLTSERSSTIIQVSASDITARRRMKADSLRTILPMHSTIPRSPILSIPKSNILVPRDGFYFWEHESCHHDRSNLSISGTETQDRAELFGGQREILRYRNHCIRRMRNDALARIQSY